MIFDQILDDAALFPPGDAPAEIAVPAHDRHRHGGYARFVGPFIVPAARLQDIAALWAQGNYGQRLEVALTFSGGPGALAETVSRAANIDRVRVLAIEVAVPASLTVTQAVSAVTDAVPDTVRAYVEVPRDERRPDLIAALAGTRLRAKFRTGGTTAEAYPDEHELAAAIHLSVAHGVAFKATAGLHHAVRNTDAATGFEQHGFLNIIAAVAAASDGATPDDVAAILRSRDGATLADAVVALTDEQADAVRQQFSSFGTCSIVEPLEDLVRLGLVRADILSAPSQGLHV